MSDDITPTQCLACGGTVDPNAETHDGQVEIDGGWVCSEICRLVAQDGLWPSPVGPATHEEMQGWIDEDRAIRRRAEEAAEVERTRLAAQKEAEDAALQQAWDEAVRKAASELP